ncbi:hypothetical protein GBA65_09215 [Rubrobacter marinus]|uniref:DUF5666 domain-containing protein n=1 Tax=Rubrobacter marinus TaxID=2653852 RepID=A0A6G8PWU9_9ACTN|nr:hypothetical protein [Rubrobacter marinus]QIN78668.1 hypothetical protein GBA65_09215 [Rubrobacter marinus]
MRRSMVFVLVAALLVAMTTGVAGAKGKPAKKPDKKPAPPVAHVFRGEIVAVDADSVLVSVEGGNSFAKPFVGKRLDIAANSRTKVVEDDVKTRLSNLDAGDAVVAKAMAPRGSQSFTADMFVATSPTAPYYLDADGDGIGAGEPRTFVIDEQPEGYVSASGDNCADVANPDQADADGNGTGDACEPVVEEPAPEVGEPAV